MSDKNEVVKYSYSSNVVDKESSGILMFLYLLLNFTLVIGVFCLIGMPSLFIWNPLGFTTKSIVFAWLDSAVVLLIVYEFENIVNRIIDNRVFIVDNVKSFDRAGFYTLLLGIVYMINEKISGHLQVLFVFDKDGNLKLDIFVFIILSCIFLVIAEVFKKAIKIKDENDLTI